MAYSLLDGEDEGIGSDKRRDQGIDDWRNSGESEVEAGCNFMVPAPVFWEQMECPT